MKPHAGAVLALLALAACRADEAALRALVPSSLTPGALIASDAKTLNCERATFEATVADPTALEDWTPLGSMFSQSFLACVDLEEQLRWKQAIARGSALWRVMDRQGDEVHLWFDRDTNRLQVLRLER